MSRFLPTLISLFFLILFIFPTRAQAAIQITIVPNPVLENRTAYIIASGCPPIGNATFTWKKNNTDSRTVDVIDGIATLEHTFSEGDYDLTVSCSGQSASTSFTSVSHKGDIYWINDGSSGDYSCNKASTSSYPDPRTGFRSLEECQNAINQLKQFVGDYWAFNTLFNTCYTSSLLPPEKQSNSYPTQQACLDAQQTIERRYDIVYLPTLGATCDVKEDGPYTSREECLAAIKNEYVWIIVQPDPNQRAYCQEVPKESAGSTKTYPTKDDCQKEIGNAKWFYSIPDSAFGVGQLIPCEQNYTRGVYETRDDCILAFCEDLQKGDNPGLFKEASEQYCKEQVEDITNKREATPAPPFPPCLIAKNASGEMIDLRQQPERKPEAKQCIVLDTGIRPFNLEPAGLIRGLFAVLMSISGGIALLMIIRSGYQIVTSQGEAEKLKEARERLISAIVGLLFLIFSLVILETIGVDILRIPGFGS